MRAPAVAVLVLLLLLAPHAAGDVARHVVPDVAGDGLVAVTFDDEKAIRLGREAAFVFVAEAVNLSLNLSVDVDVKPLNGTALRVVRDPPWTDVGGGPVTVAARLAASGDAEPRRYPVTVRVLVMDLNATPGANIVAYQDFAMNVTLSRHVTPLQETGSTLSTGEWLALAAAAAVVGVLAAPRAARAWRRRRERREHG